MLISIQLFIIISYIFHVFYLILFTLENLTFLILYSIHQFEFHNSVSHSVSIFSYNPPLLIKTPQRNNCSSICTSITKTPYFLSFPLLNSTFKSKSILYLHKVNSHISLIGILKLQHGHYLKPKLTYKLDSILRYC